MICVRQVLRLLKGGKNGVIQMQMTIFLNWLLHHCFLSSFPSETTIHAGHITALRKKEVKLNSPSPWVQSTALCMHKGSAFPAPTSPPPLPGLT